MTHNADAGLPPAVMEPGEHDLASNIRVDMELDDLPQDDEGIAQEPLAFI